MTCVQEKTASRTKLQTDADRADLDVFNLISRLECMYEAARHDDKAQESIHRALEALRSARPHIRSLMSKIDRERT